MTTTPESIRHSWIPKGRGKGGEFSNSTPYDSDADTLTSVQDIVIESNSWVPRPAEVSPNTMFVGGAGTAQWLSPVDVCNNVYTYNSLALGNFYTGSIDLVSAVYGSCISTNGASACGPIPPGAAIGGVILIDPFWPTKKTLRATLNNAKWVFKMVKNRMYMADGQDRPMISSEPRANITGTWPSSTVYPWGVNAPVSAPTYAITASAITAGSLSGAPNGVTSGSASVIGVGTSFTSATVGQTIYILGAAYTIASITDNTHLTLGGGPNGDGTYAAATGSVANGAWQINTGTMSWPAGAGYIYAYAYYDSVTGHISNMSPLLYVNDGPPNNGGVSVVLHNIAQLLDANGVNPDPRFTQILIYRSFAGGSNLFPLALISNSAASPPYSYTDTQGDDTKLGLVGPGNFPGPYTTNHPPPSDLNFIAYWNGRFWGFSTSQPGLLFYSARVDSTNSEVPVGVAEECWPLQNTIPVPGTDGVGTGLRVVGPNLMVLTTRGIYTVLGSSPGSYQLSRITSKGNGTYHFATCALPGEDANSADALVHVGNDSRLYLLYGAGGDVSYSYPIQDQIFFNANIPSTATLFLVEILHNKQGVYLLFVDSQGVTHAYDMERQVWFKWFLGFGPGGGQGNYAMCEGVLEKNNVFLFSNSAGVWALQVDPDASLCAFDSNITTQRFCPPGVDRFDSTMLSEFDLYDLEGNTTWQVLVHADGKPVMTMNPSSDTTTRSILGEPSEIYFPRNTAGGLVQGRTYTCIFTVARPTSSGKKFKLAKVEGVWVKMTPSTSEPPK